MASEVFKWKVVAHTRPTLNRLLSCMMSLNLLRMLSCNLRIWLIVAAKSYIRKSFKGIIRIRMLTRNLAPSSIWISWWISLLQILLCKISKSKSRISVSKGIGLGSQRHLSTNKYLHFLLLSIIHKKAQMNSMYCQRMILSPRIPGCVVFKASNQF